MNPLNSFLTNLLAIVNGAAVTAVVLAATIVGLLFLKGAMMGGGVQENERAKHALVGVIIGGLIVFGATFIAQAVQAAAH